jgi:uncharacterized protein (DUF1330 family)
MPKGYWVAHIDVVDPEAYKAYIRANAAPFAKFGARFFVRAGRHVVVEGASRSRQVLIEFKDYETALACYPSAEYQAVKALRTQVSSVDFVIVEGYDGPQPGETK